MANAIEQKRASGQHRMKFSECIIYLLQMAIRLSSACGDLVRLEVAFGDDGRIRQARHESQGCVISRAAAELLCAHLQGRPQDEARALTPEAMFDLL